MSCSIVELWHVSSLSFLYVVSCTIKLDRLDPILTESNKQDMVHSAF